MRTFHLVRRRDELYRRCMPDEDFAEELGKVPLETQIVCLALVVGMRQVVRPKLRYH